MYSLAAKLDAVSKNLKKGGEAAELAVKRMNIGAAVNSWNDTAEWAKKIQDLASGTAVRPVLQHDPLVRLPLIGRGPGIGPRRSAGAGAGARSPANR